MLISMNEGKNKEFKYLKFEKLIRDNNIKTLLKQNCIPNYVELNKDDFIYNLKLKLVEEANEVLEAKTIEETTDEIGDVIEVLKALIKQTKIKNRKIRKARRIKAKERGKFRKGIYCKYVKCPTSLNSKWMHKYKDITDEIEGE